LFFFTGEWKFYQMAVFVEVTINEIASILDKVGRNSVGKVSCYLDNGTLFFFPYQRQINKLN